METVTIYHFTQLPHELRFFTGELDYITEKNLDLTLNELAIELYAISELKNPDSQIKPIQGYHLGIVNGLGSIMAICEEYKAGISQYTNELYIKSLHSTLKPFFTKILVASMNNRHQQADELLAALDYCKAYYKSQITERRTINHRLLNTGMSNGSNRVQ